MFKTAETEVKRWVGEQLASLQHTVGGELQGLSDRLSAVEAQLRGEEGPAKPWALPPPAGYSWQRVPEGAAVQVGEVARVELTAPGSQLWPDVPAGQAYILVPIGWASPSPTGEPSHPWDAAPQAQPAVS